jgi:glycine C-acetyltransferase
MEEQTIRAAVVDIVRTHTLYDPSRLQPESHLEGELGIDSVVLASILGAIRSEMALPDDSLRFAPTTLRELIAGVADEVSRGAKRVTAARATPAAAAKRGGVEGRVLAIVTRHTHYAASQLRADAMLEGDLGIDSVVLTAILRDVEAELGLPARSLRTETIVSVADLLRASGASVATPAPVSARSPTSPRAAEALPPAPAVAEPVTRTKRDDLSAIVAAQLGRAPTDPAETFLAAGISAPAHRALLASIEERFGVRPALRLEDCDTMEKLARYVDAAAPHALRGVDPAQVERTNARPAGEPWDGRSMKDFVEERSKDLFAKVRSFGRFYRKRQAEHLYWYGMPLETPCRNRAVIYDEITGKRREFLMFASNNYLGLANHPRVVDAIADATKAFGATNTGCRLIGGTNVLHKELEKRLARFKGREACIVYPSGYSANLGCISALVRPNDAVIVDKLNHMSIVDGCKLSGGIRKIYQHNDMADLERVLEKSAGQVDGMLIAADGVFSMHGNICKLPDVVRLAKKYGAKVLIDDAHATGVLGARGSGTAEHFGLKGEVDLELGTMSKTLAGMGGFVVGDEEVVEYLRFYSNSYVFAANIPAGLAAGLIASIDVIETEPERITRLWSNIRYLKQHLLGCGFDLGGSESAILPIVIGDDRKALEMGRAVRARGLFCQTVVYPGVSVGEARLRVSVTSEHTKEDLDLAAQIFVDAARETGVLASASA